MSERPSNDRGFPVWEEIYRDRPGESLPWYHPHLDPDVERALGQHALTGGRALDLGTGSGTQAVALAERGFDVTGSDLSHAALIGARKLAAERGASVRFVADDILESGLAPSFALVLDRGCFHVLPPERRGRYVQNVAALLEPRGFLFLKCFSEEQPGDVGPWQLTPGQIDEIFGAAFEVLSIERTVYQGTLEQPPKALFCALRRAAAQARGGSDLSID